MQDLVVGRALRAIRHAVRWRQSDVADLADLSQDEVSRAELGRLDRMPLHRLRAIAAALDAEIVLTVRWRGGDLDRLLDEGHASLVGRLIALLEAAGWETRPEVTFSIYGERGSIDVVAWHAPTRTLLVIEVKTELTSVEDTLRRHDVKARLAARIVRERFGWDPRIVARVLVLPELSTSRRRVARHEAVFGRAYPLRGAAFRAWLRRPIGAVSGLLFLSPTTEGRGRCGPVRRRRVRRARLDAPTARSGPRSAPCTTPGRR